MKRDMDLIRDVLFTIEDELPIETKTERLSEYPESDIAKTMDLLIKEGYATAKVEHVHGQDFGIYYSADLTWKGHDFVNNCRDETIWNEAIEKISMIAGGVSIEMMGAILTGIITAKLGLS